MLKCLAADYSVSHLDLFKKFSIDYFLVSKSFRVLLGICLDVDPRPELPSWIRNWCANLHFAGANIHPQNVLYETHYNASKGSQMTVVPQGDSVFQSPAVLVDTITETFEFLRHQTMPDIISVIKSSYGEVRNSQGDAFQEQAFLRTLLGDTIAFDSTARRTGSEDCTPCKRCFLPPVPQERIHNDKILSALSRANLYRRVFKNGTRTADSEPDDEVSILQRGRVPFIIRKIYEEMAPPGPPGVQELMTHASLVGDCYLDGAMFGEAVAARVSGLRVTTILLS
jgi:hypothetical protein